ncbi:hypothetical protein LOK49_LG05G02492 [Camellia lanceoleosa]|uniref:Uncharacterized protein n=1 Tax=Camellia lanceoleosa TaxID=1840588 RepID=A0ACC0HKT3_9ERIC|nr:hypothetical protein LOK49_LG05G02492 [Camellia lanceoleosa]
MIEIRDNRVEFRCPFGHKASNFTGLLIEGDRALVVRSRVGNVMDYSEFLNENDIDLAIESDLESQSFIPDETQAGFQMRLKLQQ